MGVGLGGGLGNLNLAAICPGRSPGKSLPLSISQIFPICTRDNATSLFCQIINNYGWKKAIKKLCVVRTWNLLHIVEGF